MNRPRKDRNLRPNPFFPGRSEHEPSPVLYMPGGPQGIAAWMDSRSQLFVGVRGSGKSSTLRALSWEAAWRVSGPEIVGSRDVLDRMNTPPRHIGVFQRLEEMDISLWDKWEKTVGLEDAQKFFGVYLDFLLVDLFLNALRGIRKASPSLFAKVEVERGFVKDVLSVCFPVAENRPTLRGGGLLDAAIACRDVHTGIRNLVYRGAPATALYESFPVMGPGAALQGVADVFARYHPSKRHWSLLALLDDCNSLTEWQTRVLNTAVYRAKAPIAYKLTSVSELYKTRLTVDGRQLAEIELEQVLLPCGDQRQTVRKFLSMAQGVCRARLSKYVDEETGKHFDLRRVLGETDLEGTLGEVLRGSENRCAAQLLQEAKELAERKGQTLSVTSAWLSQKEVREDVDFAALPPEQRAFEARRHHSAYKKKWDHAAAVALCRELGITFPYHGWRTFMHLSYGSIREMLRLMKQLWDMGALKPTVLRGNRTIDRATQTEAIIDVAEAKVGLIDRKPVFSGASLWDICQRLGGLFRECQSFPYVCTTAETAAVHVKLGDLDPDPDTLAIVDSAVMAGVLVMRRPKGKERMELGLHPILAPKFGLSYRSPFYYPEPIKTRQLATILTADAQAAESVVDRILRSRLERYMKRYGRKLVDERRPGAQMQFDFEE